MSNVDKVVDKSKVKVSDSKVSSRYFSNDVMKITPYTKRVITPQKPKQREEVLNVYKNTECQYIVGVKCSLAQCTLMKCNRVQEKAQLVTPELSLPPKHKIYVEMGDDYFRRVHMKATASKYKTPTINSGHLITRESPSKLSIFSDEERDAINEGITANKRSEPTITYPVDISTEED